MTIEHNLKHSLWKDDPHMARALFEEELREKIKHKPKSMWESGYQQAVKENLGEVE